MSWLQKLYDTYESIKGHEPEGSQPLMPIAHTTQQAHVEVVLDGSGRFRRANVLDKSASTTLIPCTEESGGRAGSKPVNHPLCDKLQYLARDYAKFGGEVTSGFARDPEEPHRTYLASLSSWASSANSHVKLDAIRRYVEQGSMVKDLVEVKVLPVDSEGRLLKSWVGAKDQVPDIYKALPPGQTPEDAFIRWSVEHDGTPASGTWQDDALISAWIAHYAATKTNHGYCMVLGENRTLAVQHPAKLRNAGDKAKLISANDSTGYTYRGRFLESGEAASVGFEVTQKAHNALRWLIARQGSRGDQAVVSWAPSGVPVPDPMAGTYELLGVGPSQASDATAIGDAGQAFALRLQRAMQGYRARLDPTEGIVVMGLDSATPGRLAITYYREIQGSDFLQRIEAWHLQCAWPQHFGKESKFVGAPSPRDIAQAAYGRRLDEKLEKAARERLLPCIVDAAPIPMDIVDSTKRRAINRVGLDRWEWEKCLGIACALFRGKHRERNYRMALELERTSRDYLFGRLLAIAERIEGYALYLAKEKRETTAARMMQRFADRPHSAWRTIELALVPYKTRLRNLRPSFLYVRERDLDEVLGAFKADDFMRDAPLTAEFLLGYHCQRAALRPTDRVAEEDESIDNED
jgi:CRISPR-associated protein Csd1